MRPQWAPGRAGVNCFGAANDARLDMTPQNGSMVKTTAAHRWRIQFLSESEDLLLFPNGFLAITAAFCSFEQIKAGFPGQAG